MLIKRIVFSVIAVILAFFAPWWVVLMYAIIGIILFPWYLEALFLGLYFDTMYGIPTLQWYIRIMHTVLFVTPLGIAEFIKRRINL
ncbi:MAG: hypothetical protein WCG20_01065 [bacterium]